MEHTGYLQNPKFVPLKVPYLCTTPYEYGGFYNFPTRHGRSIQWPCDIHTQLENKEDLSRSDSEESAFLQTWLYFGLLSEIIGAPIDPIKDSLVTEIDETPYISTAGLPVLLEGWRSRMERLSPAESASHLRVVDLILSNARYNFYWALRVAIDFPEHRFLSDGMELYIITLVNTLNYFKIAIMYQLKQHKDRQELFVGWGSGTCKFLKERMLMNGWCPADIEKLTESVCQGTLYYISCCFPPRLPSLHLACSDIDCVASVVNDPDNQEPDHIDTLCRCERFEIQVDNVRNIIKDGKLPLVCIEKDPAQSGWTYNFEEAEEGIKYIAFSHVWSDGLGNGKGNWIPHCQLKRLGYLAQSVDELEGTIGSRFFVWIDTLCIPRIDMETRKMAVANLRAVYEGADKVIVLDKYLSLLESDIITAEDHLLAVACSNWVRRLWTLQEGILARKLYFAFSKSTICLEDLLKKRLCEWARLQNTIDLDLGTVRTETEWSRLTVLGTDAITLYDSWMELNFNRSNIELSDRSAEEKQTELVRHVWQALKWRSTSRMIDESICIGTLFNADTLTLQNTPAQERMKKLFSLLEIFPADAVFYRGKYMDMDGYRWAPTSFLDKEGHFLMDRGVGEKYGEVGRVSTLGLEANFHGFILNATLSPLESMFYFLAVSQRDPKVYDYFKVEMDGPQVLVPWHTYHLAQAWFGLIYKDPTLFPGRRPCVLLKFEREDLRDGVIYAKKIGTGLVSVVLNPEELRKAQAYFQEECEQGKEVTTSRVCVGSPRGPGKKRWCIG